MKELVNSLEVSSDRHWESGAFPCSVNSSDEVAFEAYIDGLTIITEEQGNCNVICLSVEDSKALVRALNKIEGLLWRE